MLRAAAPQSAGWSPEADLLALLAELVDAGNRLFFAAHAKKGTRLPRPVKVPRPYAGERTRERRNTSAAELRESFGPNVIQFTPKE